MNDKLIYEFASKLNRTKNQYESTKKQGDVLKREAIRLEKVWENIDQNSYFIKGIRKSPTRKIISRTNRI